MDSYDKYASDFIKCYEYFDIFSEVKEEDLLEVAFAFGSALGTNTDCEDNFRVFPNTKSGKKKYNEVKKQGCCGFFDSMIRCSSGNVYLYGFNYGH